MTLHRALTLTVALGLLLPCAAGLGSADASAAMVRSSAPTPEAARRQLDALHAAGVRTHGALATASPKLLVQVFGRRQARLLQGSARLQTGPRGLLDPSTELDVVSIIDPQFVPSPVFKSSPDVERRLAAARRDMRSLAETGLTTYGDLARADRRELAALVGRSRARAMVATVESLQRHLRAPSGSASIIDPQFLKADFDAAFVADPAVVSNVESPLSKVGANPTPHP
jgi:hypothetical protein